MYNVTIFCHLPDRPKSCEYAQPCFLHGLILFRFSCILGVDNVGGVRHGFWNLRPSVSLWCDGYRGCTYAPVWHVTCHRVAGFKQYVLCSHVASIQWHRSPPKPIMHIAYSPCFRKMYKFPHIFVQFTFLAEFTFLASPILTMMHLHKMLYTYWTPLQVFIGIYFGGSPAHGPLIIEKRPCFHQLFPPCSPQYF